MDIKNLNNTDPRPNRTDRGPAEAPGSAASSKGGASARPQTPDQVTLTESAQRLLEASRSASDAGAVDQARVQAIRQSLADGSYVIDPERIAAGLLRMEQELGD